MPVRRGFWLFLVALLSAAVLYRNRLRAYLEQASANVRAFDLPTAGTYDALVARHRSGRRLLLALLAAAVLGLIGCGGEQVQDAPGQQQSKNPPEAQTQKVPVEGGATPTSAPKAWRRCWSRRSSRW